VDLNSLSAYDFNLPPERIAQSPASPRDQSRLLVLDRASGSWEHKRFTDIPEYFDSSDVLVANNTQVIKARLLGHRLVEEGDGFRPGGKVEFVLLEELEPLVWEGLFHASAKYNPGLCFEIPTPDGRGLRGVLIKGSKDSPHGTVVAEFDFDPVSSGAGELPLPHYIDRVESAPSAGDEASYQTVYAKVPGSAAAPTAGLHFTPQVLDRLKEQGSEWEEVTLNVGLGTFRPVKESEISKHLMHEERYEISDEVARRLSLAKFQGKRLTAVGTTSVRTLESAWRAAAAPDPSGRQPIRHFESGVGRTSLFIRPEHYTFQAVDRLITNFHLPRSTLLMLVCTFAGRDLVMAAYEEAIREGYRFFSYGDAMLII
jgi:S-adenosylmethionine:tRNA ribosyltransferase-isomerase